MRGVLGGLTVQSPRLALPEVNSALDVGQRGLVIVVVISSVTPGSQPHHFTSLGFIGSLFLNEDSFLVTCL